MPELGKRPPVLEAAPLGRRELRVVKRGGELVRRGPVRLRARDVGRGRVREPGGERADVIAEEELRRGVEGEPGDEVLGSMRGLSLCVWSGRRKVSQPYLPVHGVALPHTVLHELEGIVRVPSGEFSEGTCQSLW